MEQPAPGMSDSKGRGGSRRWLLAIGLAVGMIAFAIVSSVLHQQRMADMVDQLGASDAQDRAAAIDYLFNGSAYEAGRLADSPRAQRRLEDASASFSDAALAQLFDEVIEPRVGQWYELAYDAPLTYYRSISAAVRLHPSDLEKRLWALTRLDMALHSGQRESGYGVVWDVADQTERDLILETFRVFIEAYANDRSAGPETGYYTALSLIGEAAIPLVEPLLNAPYHQVQREAWLVIGLLDSGNAHTAQWSEAPHLVAEAMIASTVISATDPDDAIEQFRQQIEVESPLTVVLDALEELPHDGQGRIDLDADRPQTTPAPELLSDLYRVRDRLHYASTRLESFRENHGYAID